MRPSVTMCMSVARNHPQARPSAGSGVSLVKLTRLPQQLAFLSLPQLKIVFRRFRPDVIMERYYNFAGAGICSAHLRDIPSLLEVNAPMVDPPGSLKTRLDRLLLGTMRRWAVRQARWSDAIVTPLASTVPPRCRPAKFDELPWGANVERFDPALRLPTPTVSPPSRRSSASTRGARRGVRRQLPPGTASAISSRPLAG